MEDEGITATAVVGEGAIGIVLTTALGTGTDHRLLVIAKPNSAAVIRREGIHRTGVLGHASLSPNRIEVYDAVEEIPIAVVKRVVIAVKCYQMSQVAQELAQRPDLFGPKTDYFCFQNGWDAAKPLLSITTPRHIYLARVITGAHRTHPNRTEVTVHQDDVLVGGSCDDAPLGPAEKLAGNLRSGGIPTRATDQISKFLWEKLLYNVCVNAPGALFNRSLGELMDDLETRMLLDGLLEEAWCAMVCAGHSTRFATFQEYHRHFEDNLVPRTRNHKSSMSQDLQLEHPTEIDWLNGVICRIARSKGWIAGLNQWITNRIHRLETPLYSYSSTIASVGDAAVDKGVRL